MFISSKFRTWFSLSSLVSLAVGACLTLQVSEASAKSTHRNPWAKTRAGCAALTPVTARRYINQAPPSLKTDQAKIDYLVGMSAMAQRNGRCFTDTLEAEPSVKGLPPWAADSLAEQQARLNQVASKHARATSVLKRVTRGGKPKLRLRKTPTRFVRRDGGPAEPLPPIPASVRPLKVAPTPWTLGWKDMVEAAGSFVLEDQVQGDMVGSNVKLEGGVMIIGINVPLVRCVGSGQYKASFTGTLALYAIGQSQLVLNEKSPIWSANTAVGGKSDLLDKNWPFISKKFEIDQTKPPFKGLAQKILDYVKVDVGAWVLANFRIKVGLYPDEKSHGIVLRATPAFLAKAGAYIMVGPGPKAIDFIVEKFKLPKDQVEQWFGVIKIGLEGDLTLLKIQAPLGAGLGVIQTGPKKWAFTEQLEAKYDVGLLQGGLAIVAKLPEGLAKLFGQEANVRIFEFPINGFSKANVLAQYRNPNARVREWGEGAADEGEQSPPGVGPINVAEPPELDGANGQQPSQPELAAPKPAAPQPQPPAAQPVAKPPEIMEAPEL